MVIYHGCKFNSRESSFVSFPFCVRTYCLVDIIDLFLFEASTNACSSMNINYYTASFPNKLTTVNICQETFKNHCGHPSLA